MTTMTTTEKDLCLEALAEAGIEKKDADTALRVLENRLAAIFFLPKLLQMLEEMQLSQTQIEDRFRYFFGPDVGRAAIVIAKRTQGE
jgi:hypothetical protein